MTYAAITGWGACMPPAVLTNADLSTFLDTSDEWITTRTGIKQRRKAGPHEYTSQFAVRAARQAIENARLDPSDIDLLLCATVTPDQILPSTGCIIQAELGANNAAAAYGSLQQAYDVSYTQCMYAHGDTVRPAPTGYAGYPYASYPYGYAYPGYFGGGYYGAGYYGPSIAIGFGGGWGGGWGWGRGGWHGGSHH